MDSVVLKGHLCTRLVPNDAVPLHVFPDPSRKEFTFAWKSNAMGSDAFR